MTPDVESRAPWLADLPKNWRPVRMKFVKRGAFDYGANEAAELGDPDLPRFIRITDIREDGTLRDETFRSLPESVARPYLLQEGDILLARSGATVGKAFTYRRSWGRACFAGYLIRLRVDPRAASTEFLRYFTQSYGYGQEIQLATIQATIQNVSAERYANFVVPLPALDAQRRVVSFLDRKTAAIDALIAKKERLIELLQEKRQALVTQAVTKGLDANTSTKDSGVGWLGDIPSHWSVSRPKFLCTRIVDGVHAKPSYVDDGIPFVTVKNLTAGDGISFDDLHFITESDHAEFSRRANPQRGDVLITKDGTLGVCRVVETDRVFSIFVSVAVLKPRSGLIDPYFLRFVLESGVVTTQFQSRKAGSGLKHLHLEEIGGVSVPLPPLAEQRAIAARVRSIHVQHIEVIDRIDRHIERLREYRQALITAAVTGKIDVSKEAA